MTGWPALLSGVQEWFDSLRRAVEGIARAVWDLLPGWLRYAINLLAGFGKWAFDRLYAFVTDPVGFLMGLGEWIWTKTSEFLTTIWTFLQGIGDVVWRALPADWRDFIKRVAKFTSEIIDKIVAFFTDIGRAFLGTVLWIWDNLPPFLKEPLMWIVSLPIKIGELIIAFFKDPIGTLSNLKDKIVSSISETQKAITGAISSGINWIYGEVKKVFDDIVEKFTGWIADLLKGLWALFEQGLKAVIEWTTTNLLPLIKPIVSFVVAAITTFADIIGKALTDMFSRVREAFRPASPPVELTESFTGIALDFHARIKEIIEKEIKSPITYDAALKAATGIMTVGAGVAALGLSLGMAMEAGYPTKELGAARAAELMLSYIGVDRVIAPFVLMPYTEGIIPVLKRGVRDIYRPEVPSYADAREMLWRGKLKIEDVIQILKWEGYEDKYIEGFKELTNRIPSVADIITMMVREVFDPARFEELVAEYPPRATILGALHGYSEEWMKRFWAMHWVLPALGDLYACYHRGIIDKETLTKWIKYHDYEEKVREWLIERTWELPGRIDMRWMYEWGVLVRYKDVFGRDVPEWSEIEAMTDEEKALTEWLIADGIAPKVAPYVARAWIRNLLREEIMKVFSAQVDRFVNGLITEDELKKEIEALGIPAARREYYVKAAVLAREVEVAKDAIAAYSGMFAKGLIDKTVLISELDKIIKVAEVRDVIVKLAESRKKVEEEKKAKEVRLTVAMVGGLYRRKMIDTQKAVEYWKKLGYGDEDIELLKKYYKVPEE